VSQSKTATINALLGYPVDARLLIVNADDLGMYPAINEAVSRAFREGIVQSTSLMMPCPGAADAIDLLQELRDLPFAVHLSVIRDIPDYVWGPVAPKGEVPSLLDDDGNLYTSAKMAQMLKAATLEDLETEFRAQIETVLATGLQPTHLDWHCLLDGGRDDVFDLTLNLAREHGLALRASKPSSIAKVRQLGLPSSDHDLLDSFRLDLATKSDQYAAYLRSLPPGLTDWAVHPGLGTTNARSIDPEGWPVRSSDLQFLVSQQAKEIIAQEGLTLLSYASLQPLWQANSAPRPRD
jgi:predicted glycoside hydrolase/deacetylase ChbG (UPF0249 family)